MNKKTSEQLVYIIDDDEAVLDSLGVFLQAEGLKNRTYANPQDFLADYHSEMCGCLVLDMQMPALSGLALQQELVAIGSMLPIVFITGHGNVSTAVQAMKAGAFEFIEKPFDHNLLLEHIRRAFKLDAENRRDLVEQQQIRARLETLTPREKEVLDYIITGKATKVIAIELSLSQRTVEIYRANVMQKMQSKSVAQLVSMLSQFNRQFNAL